MVCTADEYAVQKMKEELCFASLDFEADTAKAADLQKSFTLPNGQSIVLGTERFSCVEPLFNLEMIGWITYDAMFEWICWPFGKEW